MLLSLDSWGSMASGWWWTFLRSNDDVSTKSAGYPSTLVFFLYMIRFLALVVLLYTRTHESPSNVYIYKSSFNTGNSFVCWMGMSTWSCM